VDQIKDLKASFHRAFAPLSRDVGVQLIAAIPPAAGTPESLIEGRSHQRAAQKDGIPFLSQADQRRVREAYEKRNAEAAESLAPHLRSWLNSAITPDKKGRQSLDKLSQDMLGSALADLPKSNLSGPYRKIARTILTREEKLRFQICNLPPGFEELHDLLCGKDTITEIFERG